MPSRHSRSSSGTRKPVAPLHRGPQAAPLVPSLVPLAPIATTGGATAVAPYAPNAAMLIDFDNVTMGIRSDLQEELKNLLSSDIIKGKVAVRRAYADWRRYPQYIVPLTEASIDLIFAPAYGSAKKNATDIRLAIDALELVFTRPEIGTFVLLSGDSDFSSMVIKLKEYGKYVIGVGIRESSSDLLVMNCDEYYSYNALAGLVRTGEEEVTRWDPWELVTEAVQRMVRNGDVMRADRLKQVMQEIDAQFDEKNLGMSKFSRFVQEAQQRGLLLVTKLDNGQLEIGLPDSATAAGTVAAAARTTAPSGAAGAQESSALRASGGAGASVAPAGTPEGESDGEPKERRGRRGRRGGRGSNRDREESPSAVAGATSAASESPAAVAATPAVLAPAVAVAAVRETPSRSAPVARAAAVVDSSFGVRGEKLTRGEAFDLVQRAVAALITGDATVSAQAVRKQAYTLLGRDSETLSPSMFERLLKDAHDADVIDLRRRGDDFDVARVAEAASITEQLKAKDDALEVARKEEARAKGPTMPQGLGSRGRMAGRGVRPSTVPPELLLVGVVGASSSSAPSMAPASAPATPPAPAAAKAAPAKAAPAKAAPAKAAPSKASTAKPAAVKSPAKNSAPAKKTTAAKSPAKKSVAKKSAAKSPAKAAPKKAPAKKKATR